MSDKFKKGRSTIAIIIVVVIIMVAAFFFWNKTHADNVISGTVEFTGTLPANDAEGIVIIEAREHGAINFDEIEEFDMWDDLAWEWDESLRGGNYDLRAKLEINGEEVTRSHIVKVSAPASNEELDLDLNLENLPEDKVSGALAKHGEYVNLDGLIKIHGHVPENSHVKVYTKTLDGDYVDIKGNFPATDDTKWNWDSAQPGVRYTMVAQLVSAAGHVIGESQSIHASAPAIGQDLVIESNAHHINKDDGSHHKVAVSGRIDLNGPTEKRSSVRILYRLPGEKNFTLADKINTVDNGKWEWKNAQSGQRYEMTACYAIEDKCQSVSAHQFVNAPAKHVKFKVNTGLSLDKPHHKPELKECSKNGSKYTARIEIPHEKEARSYLVQVGGRSGHHDVYDHKKDRSAHDDSFDITVEVDPGKHYYAQYATAHCHDCGDDNYSHFSHNLRFSCGEEGDNALTIKQPEPKTHEDAHPVHTQAGVKGYKWDSGTKTCVETEDKDAPYAHTNAGLSQCQKQAGRTGADAHPNVVNNIDNSSTTDSHNVTNVIQKAKDTVTGQDTKTPDTTATAKTTPPTWLNDAKKACKASGGHMTHNTQGNGVEQRICKNDKGNKCDAKALLDGICTLSTKSVKSTKAVAPVPVSDEPPVADAVAIAAKIHEEAKKKTEIAKKEHEEAIIAHKKANAAKKAAEQKKVEEKRIALEEQKKEEARHEAALEAKKVAAATAEKIAVATKSAKDTVVEKEKQTGAAVVQKTTDLTHEAAQACVMSGGTISADTAVLTKDILHDADGALGICTFADGSHCTNTEVYNNGRCLTL